MSILQDKEGVVQAVRKDRKGFQLEDEWYSAFNPSQIDGVEKGAKVSFKFKENGTFKNLSGKVTVISSTAPSGGGFKPRGDYENSDRQLSICRQNALTNARELMTVIYEHNPESFKDRDIIEDIIQAAYRFEDYTTGKLDREDLESVTESMAGE